MKKEELKNLIVLYDTPTIAEFIGFGWGQNLVAKYLVWKVNRKLDRYIKRQERQEYLKEKGFIKSI